MAQSIHSCVPRYTFVEYGSNQNKFCALKEITSYQGEADNQQSIM